LDKRT